ncbi:MAG: hydrolase [Candidatus Woesearchaeota archaeon]
MKEEICCPKFNPKQWNGKVIQWKNKRFIKDKVFTIFYMPINFGSVIRRLMKNIDAANTECSDWMSLSEHTSKWNMNLYLAVDKKVLDVENVALSGKFISKVYEGPFKDTGKWCKDFEDYINSKKIKIKKQYMWYTTCPKCAKKYGKNYVVIIAEVKKE